MREPHFVHFVSVGASSLMFVAFLEAAVDLDVLYLGVAIYIPLNYSKLHNIVIVNKIVVSVNNSSFLFYF